ncbi:proline racemase family protein [Psychrobacter arenosus]|uniref:proline racemase family protein n=1 Tax=Psychrobacter arenosus TaxID=256326 RepID=UPI00191B492C|nr:proline racemase family protein [Psychrobacter arenosus]
MSATLFNFKIIDSHTGGEPTRMVYEGFPELSGHTIQEKLQDFQRNYDHLRQSIILEPRGNDVLVGALLCPPTDPRATAAVIFFNNHGYLGMCGHGTIGVIASLAYQQKITPGEHYLETTVGLVKATWHEDGSCSVQNVPSYRYQQQVEVQVPNVGPIFGDIAWGGNWFFLVSEHGQAIEASNVQKLTQLSLQIKSALHKAGITGADNGEIDHIELFGSSDLAQANSKSFVLCPGAAYDRSPCGTGTSAKLACLAADNLLAPGETWIQQSVIGSLFSARYQSHSDNTIIPTIRGYAHVCAETSLIIQDSDPFKWGISL